MFWRRQESKEGGVKLPGPKDLPELVGRYMIVQEKENPDWVWALRAVVRPAGKKALYCRVFNEAQAVQAGVKVKDWSSLDGHPDLILWEGYFDKEKMTVRREKFVGPSGPSN